MSGASVKCRTYPFEEANGGYAYVGLEIEILVLSQANRRSRPGPQRSNSAILLFPVGLRCRRRLDCECHWTRVATNAATSFSHNWLVCRLGHESCGEVGLGGADRIPGRAAERYSTGFPGP